MSKLVSIPDDGFVKVPIMVPDIDTPIGYRYVNLGFMPAVENNQGARGKWRQSKGAGTYCSVCGKSPTLGLNCDLHEAFHPDFCPNCGSDNRA